VPQLPHKRHHDQFLPELWAEEGNVTMNKKSLFRWCVVLVLILAIFNILYFAIPYPHPSAGLWWLVYAFEMASLLSLGFVAYDAFSHQGIKSKVYGWPIFKVGLIYAIAQTVITLTVTILEGVLSTFAKVEVPLWIPAVVSGILLILAIIGYIGASEAKDYVLKAESGNSARPVDTAFIKELRVNFQSLLASISDEELKKRVSEVAEKVRYCDPVSSPSLTEIEDEITRDYVELADAVSKKDTPSSYDWLNRLSRLLDERAELAKADKKKTA
jgi:magnesium-transporting ATPase (P-type)